MGLLRYRWPLLAAIWLAGIPRAWDIRQGDWHYSVQAARLLTGHGPGSGLHVFAAHPELTMGPLTVVLARVLELGGTNGLARAEVLGWVLGPVALWLLERAALRVRPASERRFVQATTLVGGAMLLQTWAHASGTMTHLDDVLTMSFAALAVWAVAERRPWLLAAAVGLAAASKPWGVLLLPLCFAPRLGNPWRTATAAVAATALPWLPFLLGDHATLSGSSYTQVIDPASGLSALGVHASQMPQWVRPAQVLLGIALGVAFVRRAHWGSAVAVAIAVRLALDPQVYGYYTPTFVLAALVLDLVAARRALPVATTITYVAIEVVPAWFQNSTVLGDLRVADAVVLAALAALTLRERVASSAAWGRQIPCTTR
jgi:hypothetical protein